MKLTSSLAVASLVIVGIATQTLISDASTNANGPGVTKSVTQISKSLAGMPLTFAVNQGQWDDNVKFRADSRGATMWFSSDGAIYQFSRPINSADHNGAEVAERRSSIKPYQASESNTGQFESIMIKANFIGSNASASIVGLEELDYKTNYFIGNDESRWATDVPNYTAIMYKNIYDGIDLKYYSDGRHMEYDFIVEPGADYSQIKIQYEGVEAVAVNARGELVVTTKWGQVIEQRPVVYQTDHNVRISVDGTYLLTGDNSFTFVLSSYNPSLPLVIDPILVYSTYLGSSGTERASGIAVDEHGAMYVFGQTQSTDFPVSNALDTVLGGFSDCFLTKLNSTGSSLIYSTYFGGSGAEFTDNVKIDKSGAVFFSGTTTSTDFPIVSGYQDSFAGVRDAFITKLGPGGNSIIFSTYLGGSDLDECIQIAIDSVGSVYMIGTTQSTDFPTLNAYQSTFQGALDDVFIAKLSPSGSNLIYSTYLGGSDRDFAVGIALDPNGAVYASGTTRSTDFPVLNAFQSAYQGGDNDVFVTKLNPAGNGVIYSTYLGSDGADYGGQLAVDNSGALYILGETDSDNFPTLNPYMAANPGTDYYGLTITKLSAAGNSLVYSTYVGGVGDDEALAIVVDDAGAAWIAGETDATSFPVVDAFQTTFNGGNNDGVVCKLNPAGDTLVFSTYLGGNGQDYPVAMAIDISGAIYLAGGTFSTDFPTRNPFQGSRGGGGTGIYDAFVTKFKADLISFNDSVSPGSNVVAFGTNEQTLTFDSVDAGGTVTVEYTPIGPEISANLVLLPAALPTFYDISSTVSFEGNVELCFMYDPANVVNADSVALWHYDSTGNWVDITTSLDTSAHIVCGVTDHFSPFVVAAPAVAVGIDDGDGSTLPELFSLAQNYPNPFNPSTSIEFSLPTSSHVKITIFNVLGQQVEELVDQPYAAGHYRVTWDGTSSTGAKTSSGIYFYRVETDNSVETRKMLLLK